LQKWWYAACFNKKERCGEDDLCSSVGSLTNASEISNTLQIVKNTKVSSATVSNYLNYLIIRKRENIE